MVLSTIKSGGNYGTVTKYYYGEIVVVARGVEVR